ncbi:hypothetical protein PTKIN_Ptkin08bG0115600 [Pterospermum kingtungense]
MHASPLKKGITFNKQYNTKTKTKVFLAQMQTNARGKDAVTGVHPIGGGALARRLNLRDYSLPNPTLKPQGDGKQHTEPHDGIDYL